MVKLDWDFPFAGSSCLVPFMLGQTYSPQMIKFVLDDDRNLIGTSITRNVVSSSVKQLI